MLTGTGVTPRIGRARLLNDLKNLAGELSFVERRLVRCRIARRAVSSGLPPRGRDLPHAARQGFGPIGRQLGRAWSPCDAYLSLWSKLRTEYFLVTCLLLFEGTNSVADPSIGLKYKFPMSMIAAAYGASAPLFATLAERRPHLRQRSKLWRDCRRKRGVTSARSPPRKLVYPKAEL